MTILPPRLHRDGHSVRKRVNIAGILGLLTVAACDLPSAPPAFDSRWIVPSEETRFGVEELLPGDVTLAPDSSSFIVDFDPVTYSEALGALCLACLASDGLTVPKPEFTGAAAADIGFPPEVTAVTVLDGTVVVEIDNGFNFDPLRPAAGVTGTLSISITDDADGDVLGVVVIDGLDTPFGAGTTLVDSVTLAPTVVDGAIRAVATLDSPLGDVVTIDASLPLTVTVTPQGIRVGDVEIAVAGRSVDLDPVSLDLVGVDQEVIDRIVSGAFVLDVANPFSVGADFQLSISGPTIQTIDKSVAIGPASETVERIEFTPAELQSFLGQPDVLLSGGAVVDAGAGTVRVSPGQALVMNASLDLTLRVGG